MTEMDKRRYAYEKAIEAYWKHVDRYHTWMNYYSLFNGALFVGFCTFLTATTRVKQDGDVFYLSNNYTCYVVFICLVGLIASICWRYSLLGHQAWERNWMNIIEYYEDSSNFVYSLLITNANDIEGLNGSSKEHKLKKDERFKAFSTHKVTLLFIGSVIVSWVLILLILLVCNICDNCVDGCCGCFICNRCIFWSPVVGIIVLALLTIAFKGNLMPFLYSSVEGKTWRIKS